MIAALFVEKDGCYSGLDGVDVWDIERDARKYAGPWPVVAHPPCARWSVLAGLVESLGGKKRGDDDGCFQSALDSVRRYGGVLEHPASSSAFKAHGLPRPSRHGGWQRTLCGGAVCCVEQGRYGHPAPKSTWLYAFGVDLPMMRWGVGVETEFVVGYNKNREAGDRRREMPKSQRIVTPPEFRDVLLAMARSASGVAK